MSSKRNVANEILSSRLGNLIRDSIMKTTCNSNNSCVVIKPNLIEEPIKDNKKIITCHCEVCECEFEISKLQNFICEKCVCSQLREKIYYCDDIWMNMAERVELLNDTCSEMNVTINRKIFNYLKNLYDFKGGIYLRHNKIRVFKKYENEPCN